MSYLIYTITVDGVEYDVFIDRYKAQRMAVGAHESKGKQSIDGPVTIKKRKETLLGK